MVSGLIALLISGAGATINAGELRSAIVQCVMCGQRNGCYACVGGGAAAACYTFDCASCVTSGICGKGGGGGGTGDVIKSPEHPQKSDRIFTLDASLVRMVATIHPRLAATLANLSSVGLKADTYSVHWLPVPLKESDVDAFIHRSQHQAFFTKFSEQSRRVGEQVAAGEVHEIVFQIRAEEIEGGMTLTMTVLSGSELDPPLKSLTVKAMGDSQDPGLLRFADWSIDGVFSN